MATSELAGQGASGRRLPPRHEGAWAEEARVQSFQLHLLDLSGCRSCRVCSSASLQSTWKKELDADCTEDSNALPHIAFLRMAYCYCTTVLFRERSGWGQLPSLTPSFGEVPCLDLQDEMQLCDWLKHAHNLRCRIGADSKVRVFLSLFFCQIVIAGLFVSHHV